METPLRIAITCGEPAGIGAEAVIKALAARPAPTSEILLVGPHEVWSRAFDAAGRPKTCPATEIPIKTPPFEWEWGKINRDSATAALEAVKLAARMAMDGEADAIVTAPLTKEGLTLAGCDAPGHTELLGEITGSPSPRMLFHSGDMKVILVTTHLPLREVAGAITFDRVLSTIRAAHDGLTNDFGIPAPRIAVTGLNPHAGENGRLGSEEKEIIEPAVSAARALGIDAYGPFPADALFGRAGIDRYDIIVAMYHDQGLGPFKTLHMSDGVNVTMGLPIVRTSPDHGTAFPIAGKGAADPASTIMAIRTAEEIALRRKAMKP